MKSSIRRAAEAFILGATIALVVEALLRVLTSAIRVSGGIMPPWWGRAAEDSVWIAFGVVLWLGAPIIGDLIDDSTPRATAASPRATVSRRTIWNLVGIGMLTLPLAHVLGTWLVWAMQLTAAGTWGSEGRIFISGAYYGNMLLSIAPWMAAGAIVRAWADHMIVE